MLVRKKKPLDFTLAEYSTDFSHPAFCVWQQLQNLFMDIRILHLNWRDIYSIAHNVTDPAVDKDY